MGISDDVVTAYGKDFAFLKKLASEKSAKLCIYGCGVNGEVICKFLKEYGKDIEFFVDKQAESREFEVLGKKVISPADFFGNRQNISIIVSLDNQRPVIDYLRNNGVEPKQIVCPFKKVEKRIRVPGDDYNSKEFWASSDKNTGNQESYMHEATVFTILYNTPGGMLCRTIESILGQSFKKFRYLIIDNGSTDGSENIIRQYASCDKRIKYIRLKKNMPWTDRDLLLILKEHIDTEYVAMLDSDDYYEKDFLEKTIEASKRDFSDIVQVNTLTYGHEGFRYNYFTQHLGGDLCVNEEKKKWCLLLRILNVPVWGKLYKSQLFKSLIDTMLACKTEYERDRNFCLDISWMTYMALTCDKVSICDDILHIRTWRPGSSEHSDNHSSKWLSSMVWSFELLHEYKVKYEDAIVYADSALMWLFSLPRDKCNLSVFKNRDLENRAVTEFLKRPVCDRYKGCKTGK